MKRLLFIGFWAMALNGPAQPLPPFITDSLDHYVTRAMKQWQVPGVAIAITRGDSVVYRRGFGLRQKGRPEVVTPQTLFPTGSMGKSFTGFAVALLNEQKRLSFNDRVKRWLPGFTMADKLYETDLRVVDLLTHRTGMETFRGDLLWTETNLPMRTVIQKWQTLRPHYPIRARFGYSNIAYALAGECIGAASRMRWQDYVQTQILQPLGMTRSLLDLATVRGQTDVARGHTLMGDTVAVVPAGTGAFIEAFGGMYSNVDDLSRWLMLHANDGKRAGQALFPEGVMQAVREPYSSPGMGFLPNGTVTYLNYGLGWELTTYANRQVMSHGGAYSGFLSMMSVVPQEKLGLVILTNSDAHELTEALRWQIIDAFLGQPYQNYADGIFKYVATGRTEQKKQEQILADSVRLNLRPSLPLERFAGTYTNDTYGSLTLTVAPNNTLRLTMQHHPTLTATLAYIGNNRFLCTYNHPMFGQTVWPFRVENGRVTGLTLSVNWSIEFTPYEFRKTSGTRQVVLPQN